MGTDLTVRVLLAILNLLPPDMPVFVAHCDSGWVYTPTLTRDRRKYRDRGYPAELGDQEIFVLE